MTNFENLSFWHRGNPHCISFNRFDYMSKLYKRIIQIFIPHMSQIVSLLSKITPSGHKANLPSHVIFSRKIARKKALQPAKKKNRNFNHLRLKGIFLKIP